MHIRLDKTLAQIEKNLSGDTVSLPGLKQAYEQTFRLQSQLLAAIYDMENYSGDRPPTSFAQEQAEGTIGSSMVTLTVHEPLPPMKRLTEAVEEHWKEMLHAAIREAALNGPLPYVERAFVEIAITTPKGTDNARVWDTSNRAIQIILNNLKGIFFRDDDMEHMAFSVFGRWGKEGKTVIRVTDCREITAGLEDKIPPLKGKTMGF